MAYLTYRVEITRDEARPVRDTDYRDRRLHRPRSRRGQRRSARTFRSGHRADTTDQHEFRLGTRKRFLPMGPTRIRHPPPFSLPSQNSNGHRPRSGRDPSSLLGGYGLTKRSIDSGDPFRGRAPAYFLGLISHILCQLKRLMTPRGSMQRMGCLSNPEV
jgi:hypothetical protein